MTAANTVFEWTEVQRRQENNLNSAASVSEAADRALLDSLITGGLPSAELTIPAGTANEQTRETQVRVDSATRAVNIAATAPSGTNNIPGPANSAPGDNTEVPPFRQESTVVIVTPIPLRAGTVPDVDNPSTVTIIPIAPPAITDQREISGDPAADRVLFTLDRSSTPAVPVSTTSIPISEDPALEPNVSFEASILRSTPATEEQQPTSPDVIFRNILDDDSTEVDVASSVQGPPVPAPPFDEFAGLDAAILAQQGPPVPAPPFDEFAGLDAAIAANQQLDADLGLIGINPAAPIVNPLFTINVNGGATEARNSNEVVRNNQSPDWRFRISINENTQYLYNDPDKTSILNPLKATKGVIFPYTPKIDVSYVASYSSVDITHSNYKFHNYTGSSVDQLTITGDFTAQDTFEANYLLAVIHFFRSVTKMFYGKDQNPSAGTPPPLCYLNGHGTYAFNNHPCVITSFALNYPNDVDYVNAKVPFGNLNNSSMYNKPIVGPATRWQRLANLTKTGVDVGGTRTSPIFRDPVNDLSELTRVPSKLSITINALPIVTRNDVSNNFSLKAYATGKLLLSNRTTKTGKPSKGGFW